MGPSTAAASDIMVVKEDEWEMKTVEETAAGISAVGCPQMLWASPKLLGAFGPPENLLHVT